MDKKTTRIAGQTWILTRAGPEEQFEIECILLRLLGPPAAVAASVVIDALAREAANFLANVVGEGDEFDLSRLLGDIDTRDERLKVAWGKVLEVLPQVAGDLVGQALPTFLLRLDHRDLIRLTELSVFGKVLVYVGESPHLVRDFKTLAGLLGSSPAAKYQLLAAAIQFNYGDELALLRPQDDAADDETEGGVVGEVPDP